jgi:hypothetical protein
VNEKQSSTENDLDGTRGNMGYTTRYFILRKIPVWLCLQQSSVAPGTFTKIVSKLGTVADLNLFQYQEHSEITHSFTVY